MRWFYLKIFGVQFLFSFSILFIAPLILQIQDYRTQFWIALFVAFASSFMSIAFLFLLNKKQNIKTKVRVSIPDWDSFFSEFTQQILLLDFIPIGKIDNIYYFLNSDYGRKQLVIIKKMNDGSFEFSYPFILQKFINQKIGVFKNLGFDNILEKS